MEKIWRGGLAGKPSRKKRKRTYAEDDDEQEVDVGDVVELEPQILGYEAEGRVFCRSYLVAGVVCERVAFWIALFLGQGQVEVDSPATVLLFSACV